jgi:hypothetical protein
VRGARGFVSVLGLVDAQAGFSLKKSRIDAAQQSTRITAAGERKRRMSSFNQVQDARLTGNRDSRFAK